jgi:hypothetical protein
VCSLTQSNRAVVKILLSFSVLKKFWFLVILNSHNSLVPSNVSSSIFFSCYIVPFASCFVLGFFCVIDCVPFLSSKLLK